MAQLVGRVLRQKHGIVLVLRVGGKYYPATDFNAVQFDAYLYTGDELFLKGLDDALEVK